MCGILGIIDKYNTIDSAELNRAIDIVRHRGPDGKGIFIDSNIGFAHRRLSIFDLSDRGNQPMHFKDLVIVFNGAIYNFEELKKELEYDGYKFHTRTDTEVILASYHKWGMDCVNKFNGMWSFSIYDKKNNIVFCSRDRFGIKPFYFTQINSKFCFASEIKQFTEIPGWEANINNSITIDYLKYGYLDHTDKTFFENVYQLKKGHNLIYDTNNFTFKITEYYKIEERKYDEKENFEKEKIKVRNHLFNAVKRRLKADVEVGSMLSGGIDSSIIVGLVNSIKKDSFKTVSSIYKTKKIDEEFWIDKVIELNNVVPHKIQPDVNQIFDYFDKIIWHQDEPVSGLGLFTHYKVLELSNNIGLKVLLSGQGADEIFAGYEKFYYPYIVSGLGKNPIKAIKEIFYFFEKHSINPITAIVAIINNKFIKKKTFPNWINKDFELKKPEIFTRSKDSSVFAVSKNLLLEVGLPVMLHEEDRMSMAFSIESRVPFLDHELVEKALSIPDNYKIHNGIRKYILRESGKKILPVEVYNRFDKLGFPTPTEKWFEENKDKIKTELKKNYKYIDKIVNENIFGLEDDKIIWRLLSLARWIKIFEVKVP